MRLQMGNVLRISKVIKTIVILDVILQGILNFQDICAICEQGA